MSNNLNNFYDFPCLLPRTGTQQFQINNDIITVGNRLDGNRPPSNHINNTNNDILFPQLTLTRHHVIPMNAFRRFFQTLNMLAVVNIDDNHSQFNRLQHLELINNNIRDLSDIYLENYNDQSLNQYTVTHDGFGSSGGGIVSSPNILRSVYTFSRQTIGASGGTVNVNATYLDAEVLFSTIVSWIPGNIFLGPPPSMRLDDPGEGFEYNSIHIIGQERFNILLNLLENMNTFEENPYNNIELLTNIFDSIKLLCKQNVIRFNSSQWISAYGKFSIISNTHIMKRSVRTEQKYKDIQLINNNNIVLFCEPIHLLKIINTTENSVKENECEEDTGTWSSVKRFFVGSKCSKIIHDELR